MSEGRGIYTVPQQKVLFAVPIFTGSLSLVASSVIVYGILRGRNRLSKTYHRLIFAISIMDILNSINIVFLSGRSIPSFLSESVFGASGNFCTCEMNGFLFQFGLSALIYTACLCIYFVLMLHSARRNEEMIAKRIEPLMHSISILYPLAFGIVGLGQNAFNPLDVIIGWCYFASFPANCNERDNAECIRGENYKTLSRIAGTGSWAVIYLIIIASMLAIFVQVYRQEARSKQLSFQGSHRQKRTRDTAIQALLYIGAFFLTTIFAVIIQITSRQETSSNRGYYFALVLLCKLFFPLQGVWTAFIYGRLRYRAIRPLHPNANPLKLIWIALTASSKSNVRVMVPSKQTATMATVARQSTSNTDVTANQQDEQAVDEFAPELNYDTEEYAKEDDINKSPQEGASGGESVPVSCGGDESDRVLSKKDAGVLKVSQGDADGENV